MNLLMMRHGEAVRPGGDVADHDRPLTERGREMVPRMAEILLENGLTGLECTCQGCSLQFPE